MPQGVFIAGDISCGCRRWHGGGDVRVTYIPCCILSSPGLPLYHNPLGAQCHRCSEQFENYFIDVKTLKKKIKKNI